MNTSNEVVVYHFTKKENLPSILRDGLTCCSKFNTLGSILRNNACYFWLHPANDLMGYASNSEYECLEVTINSTACIVADMDLISAAYVNYMMEKSDQALFDYNELVAFYDKSALQIDTYVIGTFRAPEVIVQRNISPENIKPVNLPTKDNGFASNRDVYNAKIRTLYSATSDMKKVAVHDDSTGLLTTYALKRTDGFITIEEFLNRKHMLFLD